MTEVSAKLCPAERPSGSFCVRLSTSKPGCFTVTFKTQSGQLSHIRITRCNHKFVYNDLSVFDSLSACVNHIINEKELRCICPGSPYDPILAANASQKAKYEFN